MAKLSELKYELEISELSLKGLKQVIRIMNLGIKLEELEEMGFNIELSRSGRLWYIMVATGTSRLVKGSTSAINGVYHQNDKDLLKLLTKAIKCVTNHMKGE